MRAIAAQFSKKMADVDKLIDILSSASALAVRTIPLPVGPPPPYLKETINIASIVSALGVSYRVTSLEGIYLFVCAEYESVVRELIEKFIGELQVKISDYSKLPMQIIKRHVKGCGEILMRSDDPRYRHINVNTVLSALNSCAVTPQNYQLIPEAFSSNKKNFWANVISEHFLNLGLQKFWNKMSTDSGMLLYFGISAPYFLDEKKIKQRVDDIVKFRNNLIHRSKPPVAATEMQLKDDAKFLGLLITGCAKILEQHLISL